MNALKRWLADFPNQNGGVVTALVLILLTGMVVIIRLARGLSFPDGYEPWLLFLGTLAGVNVVGMVGKRFTDVNYKAAGTSAVNVEAPSSVNVTRELPVATAPTALRVNVPIASPVVPPAVLTRPTEASD